MLQNPKLLFLQVWLYLGISWWREASLAPVGTGGCCQFGHQHWATKYCTVTIGTVKANSGISLLLVLLFTSLPLRGLRGR